MSADPTHDVCPGSPYGDTHHFAPSPDGRTPQGEPAYVLRCVTCGLTQEELTKK